MELFKETDDIIKLGKWAYARIPSGGRCNECLILDKENTLGTGHPHWHCGLRPAMALIYDGEGPFKDYACPKKEEL